MNYSGYFFTNDNNSYTHLTDGRLNSIVDAFTIITRLLINIGTYYTPNARNICTSNYPAPYNS